MGDPFLDNIEKALDNGDVPPLVTNRMILASLRNMDNKIDTHGAACEVRGERITLLEHWQARANGAIAAGLALGGSGLLITILKMAGVF